MQYAVKLAFASTAILALSACGAAKQWGQYDDPKGPVAELPPAPPGTSGSAAVSDFPQKIGEPYQVGGKTYTPEDVASYDEVGYASWYGQELAGNPTANGERFNPNGISAAHKTLPLPSYVEVTSLDTAAQFLFASTIAGHLQMIALSIYRTVLPNSWESTSRVWLVCGFVKSIRTSRNAPFCAPADR